MPKRHNPFGDLFAPQLKTHIGVKEVNMGVNWKYNMKLIHERTRDLLNQGSRKKLYDTNYNTIHWTPKTNNWLLQIQKEKSDLNNSMEKSCSTVDSHPQLLCSFCEHSISPDNERVCELCKGEFCHLCSILRYDQHEETAVCLSCL